MLLKLCPFVTDCRIMVTTDCAARPAIPREKDQMLRLSVSLMIGLLGTVLFAVPAFAYDETGSGKTCIDCHGTETVDVDADNEGRQGPHGNYTASTTKCKACHSVHAAEGTLLLQKTTIKANCEVCHDGTGGSGVYGVIKARTGNDPISGHRVDATGLVKGGAASGDDEARVFSGENGYLTCSDCHSPHGAKTVDPFLGDRRRETTSSPDPSDGTGTTGFTSSRLLKQRPTTASGDVQKYGSDWCATCHQGRMDGGAAFNHPVEGAADDPAGYFHYDKVQVITAPGALTTVEGKLGRSNRGYVMPYQGGSYTAGQTGHSPICQQCHEDARSVGDTTQGSLTPAEEFTATTIDGSFAGNPTYQTFPHESDSRALLLEVPDDLCTNCHDPATQLP